MSEFDPGEGWRPVPFGGLRETDALVAHFNGHTWRSWVREAPLPTEPYTVIRTGPMRWMKCGLYMHPDGTEGNPNAWLLLPFDSQTERRAVGAANLAVTCIYDVKSVREQASEFGFEVLAEPHSPEWVKALVGHQVEGVRRDTAKAVLDQVRAILPIAFDNPSLRGLEHIGHQFGVGK